MAFRGSVVKPLMSATAEVSSSGPTTIYAQFVDFPELVSQIQVIFLPGYSDRQELGIDVFRQQTSMSIFYYRPTTEARQGRREAMLEILNRLRKLKAELRQKYGEFDIEEGLEEVREERLAQLGWK